MLALWCVFCALCASDAGLIHTLQSPHEQSGGSFGRAVAGAGDTNGDGLCDVIVGAPREDLGSLIDAGRAYVFCGASGQVLHILASPNAMNGGLFGDCVAGVGDIDGDGHADILVGAFREGPGSSPMYAGRAYVFSGATGHLIRELSSPDEQFEGHFGVAVAGGGDIDGDGVPDLVVAADYENPDGSPHGAGRVYAFSGSTGALLHTLVSPHEEVDGEFGWRVAGAGDVNGDGHADILVGAHREDATPDLVNCGRAYVYDGQTGAVIHSLVSPQPQAYGFFGQSVSAVGDADGDGFDDVVVGAFLEDSGSSVPGAGRAYVFSGHTGAVITQISSPYPADNGRFGAPVAGVTPAGEPVPGTVYAGSTNEDAGGYQHAGRVYLLDALTGALLSTLLSPNPQENGHFGAAVSCAGDMDGDGRPDVVVGAPNENAVTGPAGCGLAYVFSPLLVLSGQVSGGALELQWSPHIGASAFWVYGASTAAFFEPGLSAPHQHRLQLLSGETTTWSTPNGIADADSNWTYLVVAVDPSELELARSNRIGEHDYSLGARDMQRIGQ